MKIKDRPEFRSKAAVLTFGPKALVSEAVAIMSERNYGAAVIVSPDRKPLGIVTERDFMRRLLNKRLDPDKTTLDQIMTTDLKMARADDDLLDWLRLMSNERFRHLPVIDDQGIIISMMSQGDFVSYTWPELMGRLKEQAKATFDVSPSIVLMIAGVAVFAASVVTIFTQLQ
ncbi:MAG: CBS domain-containing protein [Brevundimonas sp.]|uniref:CBS domain-containing protein n=1 Tax=Brevundimonas sp. TaxID=1871086 RepID=UPI001A31219F|nr:CBS domain-containing protein [Brevundimonas sp.]MBJ7446550.1 CBS domain-containing protein [Brevundimonas sp.]